MSTTHEGWIFTKTRKFAVNGRLQIGQILAKPFEPEFCLLPEGPRPLPEKLVQDITEELNVSLDSEHDLKAMFNLWAETTAIPVKGSVGAKTEHSNKLSWQFDSLQSIQMSLPFDYVEESMQYGEVPRHLKEWHLKDWRWNKRIFILTGVTLAKGARMVKSDTKSSGVHGNLAGDGTTASAPVSSGAEAQVESKHSTIEQVGETSNFVFAYSVNEVFYREKRQRPFRQGPGEVSSVGDRPSINRPSDASANAEIEAFILDEVAEETYTGDDEVGIRTLEVPRGKSKSGKYIILGPQGEPESAEDEVAVSN